MVMALTCCLLSVNSVVCLVQNFYAEICAYILFTQCCNLVGNERLSNASSSSSWYRYWCDHLASALIFFSEMHYILWSIHSDFCWNIPELNLILKFSWHRLSRLSWSVIDVQNCRPESFHFISSSRFVFSLGVVTLQVLPHHLVYTGICLTFCHLKHFFFEIYCILWSFYSIFYSMCYCWQLNLA